MKFICDYKGCDRIFTTKFSLKRHLLVHSQRKPLECQFCGKKFALAQYLTEHVFTHTRETPYVCNINGCTRSFRQRGKLSLHRQRHQDFQKKRYQLNPLLRAEEFQLRTERRNSFDAEEAEDKELAHPFIEERSQRLADSEFERAPKIQVSEDAVVAAPVMGGARPAFEKNLQSQHPGYRSAAFFGAQRPSGVTMAPPPARILSETAIPAA